MDPDTYYILHFLQKRTFHHELWHGVDYGMRGSSYTNDHARDPDFCKFNPRGFKYGDGGHKMRDEKPQSADELSSPSPSHFLNLYSTASIAEDRAEVWYDKLCILYCIRYEDGPVLELTTNCSCALRDYSNIPGSSHM